MTNSTLKKKLKELESELNHLYSKTPWLQHDVEEIVQKFEFLKNLLSAEIASRSSKPPRSLHLMEQRFSELNQEFWDRLHASVLMNVHADDINALTCACTDSCLEGEDDDDEDDLFTSQPVYEEDPERLSPSLVGEKALVEFSGVLKDDNALHGEFPDCLVEEKVKEENIRVEFERHVEEEEKRVGMRSICGAMASGIVLGMALMGYLMGRVCGSFHYVDQGSFLTPT